MSEKKFLLFFILVLVAIPLFIGCFDSDKGSVVDRVSSGTEDLGSLSIKMNFDNSGKMSFLAPAGVTKVKVFVGSWSVDFIAAEGEGIVSNVPAGTQSIRAEGWNATGKTHESVAQTVVIEKGKTALVNIIMTPSAATPTPPTGGIGSSWYSATSIYSPRGGHSSVVFDNGTGAKMWVLGGYDGFDYFDCVWSSSDGMSWNLHSTPQWTPRYNHSSVVHGGKMWVIGGVDNSTYSRNDVWYTTDGDNWTPGTSIPFNHANASAVSDNTNVWVIGLNGNPDVWYSPDNGAS
ncbi:hypothetical protein KAJ27_14495, partial [bacterium]|nr:hypothetical protein [bacterium]